MTSFNEGRPVHGRKGCRSAPHMRIAGLQRTRERPAQMNERGRGPSVDAVPACRANRSADGEVRMLPQLVVARQVADQRVVPGLQVQRERLCLARLEIADLTDVAGLVGLGALE